MPEADAAYLRLCFEEATAEYHKIFGSRVGKLHPNWRPSKEDVETMQIWEQMYNAVRDTNGGAAVLATIQELRDRVSALEQEIIRRDAAQAGTPAYHRPTMMECVT